MNEEFILTKDHVLLLKNAVVRWEDCEFGAPAIDCKRPYGNSNVYADMCEVLRIPVEEADYKELRKLHEETLTALQIFIQTGRMIAGRYSLVNWHWYLQSEYVDASIST